MPQVMHVVGADQRQPELARDSGQTGVDGALFLDAVPLHLEEEALLAKNVPVRGGRLERLSLLTMRQSFSDFAFEAAAQSDQAGGMLRQQLLVDARLVVEAL